jgi:hypothetical protein
MARDRSDEDRVGFEQLQYELERHLERAHELAERAQASHDVVQHEIDRAKEIVNRLRLARANDR